MVTPATILLHIPDGFLNLFVALVCWVLALLVLGLALAHTRQAFDERLVPLAGIMAAFIFAAQMINFPVAGGTSGHFVGAALAFIVLGPWLGVLAMTAVIAVQALLFQDGGLVVMGANLLVMAVVPGFVAYFVYGLSRGRSDSVRLVTAGVAAWLSVMAASFAHQPASGVQWHKRVAGGAAGYAWCSCPDWVRRSADHRGCSGVYPRGASGTAWRRQWCRCGWLGCGGSHSCYACRPVCAFCVRLSGRTGMGGGERRLSGCGRKRPL